MLPYKRSQRVGDLIREEIAEIIMNKLKDPRIGFVTVTGVDLSPDMKSARIFVSILKEEEQGHSLEALNSSRAFMRSILGKRLRMKYIPHLDFKLDESINYGFKIDKILKDIREKDEDA
ncbi:MAG: 30S ribosome-binding factor RbfA [Nitrospirae bacterium]|nr:MAG: 30S ribosome-binding factor RbfA [Nitrospirota bacterium]